MLARMRHRPKTWAVITWAVSLLAIGLAVLLSVLGANPAFFLVLALWLLTLGLPTFIAFMLVLGLWNGALPTLGLPSEVAFVIVATALALALQIGGYALAAHAARTGSVCS